MNHRYWPAVLLAAHLILSPFAEAGEIDADWESRIDTAISIADRAAANRAITRAHHGLSLALRDTLGADGGANFHTWATWGSLKAGSSIRGEDLAALKWLVIASKLSPDCYQGPFSYLTPHCALAAMTEAELNEVSRQISRGNRLVLGDIGRVSARFIREFGHADQPQPAALESFLQGVANPLLRISFSRYWLAKYEPELKRKHEHMLLGNLYAILHEHELLQPIIAAAIPEPVRQFTTANLLKFRLGDETLDVSQDVPFYARNGDTYPATLQKLEDSELRRFYAQWDHSENTVGSHATDWARLTDRMSYVCSLFRTRHLKPELFDEPE